MQLLEIEIENLYYLAKENNSRLKRINSEVYEGGFAAFFQNFIGGGNSGSGLITES